MTDNSSELEIPDYWTEQERWVYQQLVDGKIADLDVYLKMEDIFEWAI